MYGGCLLCPLYPLLHLTNTLLYVTFHRWPDGKYCIYKKGHSCSSGLDEGFVIWDDENKDNKNSKVGDLPEGLYNEDTKIFFCCSTSGSANKEIVLPNKSPFLLFAYKSILCQKVSNWKQATTSFSSLRASSPGHSAGGAGEERRACNYVSGIWIPPPIPPWLPVDWAVRFPPISAKRKRARM